jgi:homoserine kinase
MHAHDGGELQAPRGRRAEEPVDRVEVSIPASTANLGPGFDTLGLALGLYNRIRLIPGGDSVDVTVQGEGAGSLATGPENLVYRAVRRLYEEVGWPAPLMRIELCWTNRSPAITC